MIEIWQLLIQKSTILSMCVQKSLFLFQKSLLFLKNWQNCFKNFIFWAVNFEYILIEIRQFWFKIDYFFSKNHIFFKFWTVQRVRACKIIIFVSKITILCQKITIFNEILLIWVKIEHFSYNFRRKWHFFCSSMKFCCWRKFQPKK